MELNFSSLVLIEQSIRQHYHLDCKKLDKFRYSSTVLRISPISRSSIDAMELQSSQAVFTAPVLPPKSQAHQQQQQQAVLIQRQHRQQTNHQLRAVEESNGLTARLGKKVDYMAPSLIHTRHTYVICQATHCLASIYTPCEFWLT